MAKQDRASDNARVKIRVLEFEIEGGNATILDGIKQLATVIQRSPGGPVRQAPMRVMPTALNGASNADEHDDDDDDDVDDDQDTIIHDGAPAAPSAPRRPATPRKLEIVEGVDFNKGAVPLKQFVELYNLDSNMKKYTAIAAWFKQHAHTPEITVNHIYTGFKSLGWGGLPRNASGPLADLTNKSKYKWFKAGAAKGNYGINYIGEQKLEEWRKAS